MTAQYNNLDSVRDVFAANKGEIAGVILEPVVGNSGYIEPTKEFLQVCCLNSVVSVAFRSYGSRICMDLH